MVYPYIFFSLIYRKHDISKYEGDVFGWYTGIICHHMDSYKISHDISLIYHWYITDISLIFKIIKIIKHGTDISPIYHEKILIYHSSQEFVDITEIWYIRDISMHKNNFTLIYPNDMWHMKYHQIFKVYHQLWYIRMTVYHEFIRTIHHIWRRYRRKISWYIKKTDMMQWYITKVIWYLAIYRRYIAKIS